jgi:predicted Zn-dependent protease
MSERGGRPIQSDDSQRILSKEECEKLVNRLRGFERGGGWSEIRIVAWWHGELRWARNRVSLASDRRDLSISVKRLIDGTVGHTITNQLDDVSLEAAVRTAERTASLFGGRTIPGMELPPPNFTYPKAVIWSDATYNLTTEARSAVARAAVEQAESQDMLSAGYLEMRAQECAAFNQGQELVFTRLTQAQCSTTVRDQKGTGSGWAGLSGYDWAKIDPQVLSERALQKALASRAPVALEPGRYTVILEPQAVCDLVGAMFDPVVATTIYREEPEQGGGPFALGHDPALGRYRTKLGLKVVDERITISHDPEDPELGAVPIGGVHLEPLQPVKWIDRGVLTALSDLRREYMLSTRNENIGFNNSGAFRMSGGETSIEEMIRTTKRGLLVTRLSNTRVLDPGSMLTTGLTRDGLWLIEDGKITKAVKNLRFTESPLFVLNSIEQLGVPVPVFRPWKYPQLGLLMPAIVPPLKARDFSFTSTIDAV